MCAREVFVPEYMITTNYWPKTDVNMLWKFVGFAAAVNVQEREYDDLNFN